MVTDDGPPRFEWERILRRCRISGPTKLVGFVMAQYGDKQGRQIRPGFARLAAECGMGESTARRHVEALLGLGLIVRESRGGGPRRTAARYRLAVPEDLLERVDLLSPDGSAPPNSAHLSERSSSPNSAHSDERSSPPELRSPDDGTPLTAGQNSAHPGERPPSSNHPADHPSVPESPHQRATCVHGEEIRFIGVRNKQPACPECRRAAS